MLETEKHFKKQILKQKSLKHVRLWIKKCTMPPFWKKISQSFRFPIESYVEKSGFRKIMLQKNHVSIQFTT